MKRSLRLVLVLWAGTLPACGRSDRDRRAVALYPPVRSDAPGRRPPVPAWVDSAADCVPWWPRRVSLAGTIAREMHFGPPGYGEDPRHDRRMTIFVLRLEPPVSLCGDPSERPPRPRLDGIQALQLAGRLNRRALADHLGERYRVYGKLRPRAWGPDFTAAIFEVDSIPLLRRKPIPLLARTGREQVQRPAGASDRLAGAIPRCSSRATTFWTGAVPWP